MDAITVSLISQAITCAIVAGGVWLQFRLSGRTLAGFRRTGPREPSQVRKMLDNIYANVDSSSSILDDVSSRLAELKARELFRKRLSERGEPRRPF